MMQSNCLKHGISYSQSGNCPKCFFDPWMEETHGRPIASAPTTPPPPKPKDGCRKPEWWEVTYSSVVRANPVKSADFLAQAVSEMKERASTYDKPEGERSMGACVAAFKAVTGITMSEQQGWQFMELLKMVRSNQGAYRADSFVDGAAYASLAGEAAARLADKP